MILSFFYSQSYIDLFRWANFESTGKTPSFTHQGYAQEALICQQSYNYDLHLLQFWHESETKRITTNQAWYFQKVQLDETIIKSLQ